MSLYLSDLDAKKQKNDENIQSENSDQNRRQFLLSVLKATGQVTVASGVIYSLSLVTSKNGNSAGAK